MQAPGLLAALSGDDAVGADDLANVTDEGMVQFTVELAIRQHTAKTHADRYHAIDLAQRDLRLCPRCSIFGRNSSSLQPPSIVDPTVGKE